MSVHGSATHHIRLIFSAIAVCSLLLLVTSAIGCGNSSPTTPPPSGNPSDPIAVAEANTSTQVVGFPISFDASASHDTDEDDQQIVKWEWDWNNDGDYEHSDTDPYTSHAYDTPGENSVQLRVTDDEGDIDVLDEPIVLTIYEEAVFSPVDVTHPSLNKRPVDLVVNDGYLYVSNEFHGVDVYDLEDPSSPQWMGRAATNGRLRGIAYQDGLVYVVGRNGTMFITDVETPEAPYFLSSLNLSSGESWAVAVQGNYAYVGATDFYIIDTSDPSNPEIINYMNTITGTYDVAVRDNFAYLAQKNGPFMILEISDPESILIAYEIETSTVWDIELSGNYAFLAEGNHGIRVVNIEIPTEAFTCGQLSNHQQMLGLDAVGDSLYATDSTGEVHHIDISDPENPLFLETIELPGDPYEIAVLDGYAYVACYDAGLITMDISDSPSMQEVDRVQSPVWASCVDVQNGYAYTGSNEDSALYVIDVHDPENASLINSFGEFWGVYDIEVEDDLAFLAAAAVGFEILDISSPESPVLLSSSDTSGFNEIGISNDYLFTKREKLSSYNISDPTSPEFVSSIDFTSDYTPGIDIDGDILCASHRCAWYECSGISLFDISDPASMVKLSVIEIPQMASGVAIQDGYVYLADIYEDVSVIDVRNPLEPAIINSIDIEDGSFNVTVDGGYAYVAGYKSDVYIVNIMPPETAHVVTRVHTYSNPQEIVIDGNYMYVANGIGGLRIYRLF